MTTALPLWDSVFCSDRGAVRKVNEDSYLDAPELGVWAVADGMGGHEGGQLASATIVHFLASLPDTETLTETEEVVRLLIGQANRQLLAISEQTFGGKTIGSTVAILILRPGHVCCLWAGDSRIYRLRQGRLDRLTRDHSRTEELVSQGVITSADAERHPLANVITRAVGASTDFALDRRSDALEADDVFLLCSDGLYRTVNEEEMIAPLSRAECGQAAESLLALSLSRHPSDNVTLGVVRVAKDDDITLVPFT